MQPVYRHFPEVKAKHHVLLDFNHLTSPKGFEAEMPKNGTVSPSSGWLGGLCNSQSCPFLKPLSHQSCYILSPTLNEGNGYLLNLHKYPSPGRFGLCELENLGCCSTSRCYVCPPLHATFGSKAACVWFQLEQPAFRHAQH